MSWKTIPVYLVAFITLVAFVALGSVSAYAAVTKRVSISSGGVQGDGDSGYFVSPPTTDIGEVSISADGRYIAFQSTATNLVANDTNAKSDIFVRDRQTGVTERVSVSSVGEEGNDDSFAPSISADGRYVVFVSTANMLVSGDTAGHADVFVRDRQTGVTERVSVSSSGVEGDDASSSGTLDNGYYRHVPPSISGDGRYVAFESQAKNFATVVAYENVFVRDRETGITELVSQSSTGEAGNKNSGVPSISADGRYVAFASGATNLVAGDTNANTDVFVRDRQSAATERLSVSPSGAEGDGVSRFPSISRDGTCVVFISLATNLVDGGSNGHRQVYVLNRATGVMERASVSSGGVQGNDDCYHARISGDGRYVVFASDATNLATDDTNTKTDIFLRDRQTHVTERVSLTSDLSIPAQQASGNSYFPSVGDDGKYVAFGSDATNLVAGDTNAKKDVFVRDRSDTPAVDLTVTINQAVGQDDPATSEPINFTVVFNQAVADFVTGDVIIAGSAPGTKTATVTAVDDKKMAYNVAVSGMTGSGTVIARIAVGVAHNSDGDANLASTSTDNTVSYVAPVVTPVFDPDGGTFDAPVDVKVTCPAIGAKIYYTTDGRTPTNADRLVPITGIVRVDRTMTLKARAYKTGNSPSATKSAFFQITGGTNDFRLSPTFVVELPFTDELDTSYYTESVDDPAIPCFDDGRKGFCTAWWTVTLPKSTIVTASTAGSDYDTILAVYTQDADGRLHSAACNDNASDAVDTSELQFYAEPDVTYVLEIASYYIGGGRTLLSLTGEPITLPVTTATPDGGVYNTDVTVTLTAETPNSPPEPTTYFSLDGNDPLATGAFKYVVPITISSTSILKVFSVDKDGNKEPVKTILYVIDKVQPTCEATIDPDARFVTPLVFNAVFSEPVTGMGASAVAVTGGTMTAFSGTGNTYTVSVMPAGGVDVTFRVRGGTVADAAGNLNIGSNTVVVAHDTVLPSCTVTGPAFSKTAPITYNIAFSEPVTGLTSADSKIAVTGGTKGTLSGSGASYTLVVTEPVDGPVTCRVLANAVVDGFGNGNTISNLCTVQYDTKQPTVTVTAPTSPTNTTPIPFLIKFSETVTGLSAAGITVTGGTKGELTGSLTTYTLLVTPSGDGQLSCKVDTAAAHDAAGNLSKVSNAAVVVYADTPPVIKITSPVVRPTTRSCDFVNVAGTATDNARVTSVTWISDRGGSGTCTGTTDWSAKITLQPGKNLITLTATDTASKTTDALLTATYVVISPEDVWTGMTMVSIPVIPDSTDPKVVVGFSGNNWLGFDTPSNSYYRYPNAKAMFAPVESAIGRGFWATFDDTISVVNGTIPNQEVAASIALQPGWNLVGHPFTYPVTWYLTELKVQEPGKSATPIGNAPSVVASFAWGWNPVAGGTGSYVLVTDPRYVPTAKSTLEPWKGYWIRAYKECTLIIPAIRAH